MSQFDSKCLLSCFSLTASAFVMFQFDIKCLLSCFSSTASACCHVSVWQQAPVVMSQFDSKCLLSYLCCRVSVWQQGPVVMPCVWQQEPSSSSTGQFELLPSWLQYLLYKHHVFDMGIYEKVPLTLKSNIKERQTFNVLWNMSQKHVCYLLKNICMPKVFVFVFAKVKKKKMLPKKHTHLSLIHIWRCRRAAACRSRWSPYH